MSFTRINRSVRVTAIAGLALMIGWAYSQDAARPPASAPSTARGAALSDLQYGPISTFQQSCARCHGPEGAFYGKNFADMADDKLLPMVTMMMRGPGNLQPTDADALAMVAYSHAIRAKKPFVVITNAAAHAAGRETVLRGEASEGATVEIRKDGRTTAEARLADAVWIFDVAPPPPFDVVARRGGTEATLPFPARQWSDPGAPADAHQ